MIKGIFALHKTRSSIRRNAKESTRHCSCAGPNILGWYRAWARAGNDTNALPGLPWFDIPGTDLFLLLFFFCLRLLSFQHVHLMFQLMSLTPALSFMITETCIYGLSHTRGGRVIDGSETTLHFSFIQQVTQKLSFSVSPFGLYALTKRCIFLYF